MRRRDEGREGRAGEPEPTHQVPGGRWGCDGTGVPGSPHLNSRGRHGGVGSLGPTRCHTAVGSQFKRETKCVTREPVLRAHLGVGREPISPFVSSQGTAHAGPRGKETAAVSPGGSAGNTSGRAVKGLVKKEIHLKDGC